ncbi:MAG: gas vesicle protein GvpN [Planctomycetota bacterium]|nr:gas vesicle protein GvpN [Planctomycetota bacterium]
MVDEVSENAVAGTAGTVGTAGAVGAVRIPVQGEGVRVERGNGFVCTSAVEELTKRAVAYLRAGYAVHFAGTAGTGKTTLAFHVAANLGRPVMLICGDDEFGSSEFTGREAGYRKHKLVDNFIHSVLKTEEETRALWADSRLTTACQNGYTLIYDEFTRSKPEANNAFLSVLEEKILNLPKLTVSGDGYLRVHPEFRAIFTSNPEEYAGTHKTQDALMDRLITVNIGHYDRETEVEIAVAKSGVARREAEKIVNMVRELREFGVNNNRPTIRASIALARLLAHVGDDAWSNDSALFRGMCRDVLNVETAKVTRDGQSLMLRKLDEVLDRADLARKTPSCAKSSRVSGRGKQRKE